jgi:Lrp/AsnC family leucine-responsive transcriptional regulator
VLDEIRQSLEKLDEITECHLVTGDFDYLIKARLGALEDYHDLLCTLHSYLPGVVMQRSYVVMEELKETHYLRA